MVNKNVASLLMGLTSDNTSPMGAMPSAAGNQDPNRMQPLTQAQQGSRTAGMLANALGFPQTGKVINNFSTSNALLSGLSNGLNSVYQGGRSALGTLGKFFFI